MFGLRVPVAQSLGSGDFDDVPTILYNSCLREPSYWLSKVNNKGEIFELQLEQSTDAALSNSASEKDCVCFCSDCATDDTGYGTDNDLHFSLRKPDWPVKDALHDFCDVEEALNSSYVSSIDDVGHYDLGGRDFKRVEEDIDSLFQSDNCSYTERTDLGIPDLDINIPVDGYFEDNHFTEDYAEITDIEPVRFRHDYSRNIGNQKDTFTMMPPTDSSSMSSSVKKCDCESKSKQTTHLALSEVVTVKLKPRKLTDVKLTTVELCEAILGIVPGHFGSNQSSNHSSHHRKKDRRIKVRSLIPTGIAAKYTEIKVGDCLLSVNDQELTWDNLESVLKVLQHQRQAKLTLKRNGKQKGRGSLPTKKTQSSSTRMVELVSGSNCTSVSLDELTSGDWEQFYGAMYLSLEGVNSDNMKAKEDIVYQFPRVDNKVIASRGMFITLAGSVTDATRSTVQSTTLLVDNSPVHIVYHCEGQNLFVISAPENRFSLASLTSLVKDLVRLLQVTHGSIHETFTTSANHRQLDCFFALLHQSQLPQPGNGVPVQDRKCSLSQSALILPLPNEIKTFSDRMLSEFESADFGDMSDSYYGCRRSYNILGSCLFYKNYLVSNHLPKDDLVDFSTYLRYHSLLTLATDQSLGHLVVWREVYPTRACHSVPEEQQFGYTEPLIARWFWLIVGYKNMIMCVSVETGGCTKIVEGVSPPDPFLIDQARAVLMQLYAQNIANVCQNSLSHPPSSFVIKPDSLLTPEPRRNDLVTRSLKKLPHNKESLLASLGAGNDNNSGSLKRLLHKRNESFESDNSSESSGESLFKFSRKGRLFPETADLLQNISESKEDIGPINTNRKLTVGVANSLFHFQYYDNLEGVVISSQPEVGGANAVKSEVGGTTSLNEEIYQCFQQACQKIKQVFDNARKVKEQSKEEKVHVCGLNDDFVAVREEGVMFTCSPPTNDKKATPLCYWVVGRCLSRSMKREIYVCFHESTPQTVIELAFKTVIGYLPL